jgi:hypothetical protein
LKIVDYNFLRIEYILNDAKPACVVTNKNDDNDVYPVDTCVLQFEILHQKSFSLDENDLKGEEKFKNPNVEKENIFAVMFTSGRSN